MIEQLLQLFHEYPRSAILISIGINIAVAILGVVPSVFVTAANILFFGFVNGTLISFLGESAGAGLAFLLYRKGFKSSLNKKLEKFPKLNRLINAPGKEAFNGVLTLRLFPFVPSGLITFAAAIGKIRFINFLIASSLGKLPALLIEAYSVYEITKFSWAGKLILVVIATVLFFGLVKRYRKRGTG